MRCNPSIGSGLELDWETAFPVFLFTATQIIFLKDTRIIPAKPIIKCFADGILMTANN